MVDATACEKEVARKAFETEVREKRGGPAMIESVQGNVFKTRIYPIPANGSRIIRVVYRQQLDTTRTQLNGIYELPIETLLPVESVNVSIKVDVPSQKSSDTNTKPIFLPTCDFAEYTFISDAQLGKFIYQ